MALNGEYGNGGRQKNRANQKQILLKQLWIMLLPAAIMFVITMSLSSFMLGILHLENETKLLYHQLHNLLQIIWSFKLFVYCRSIYSL